MKLAWLEEVIDAYKKEGFGTFLKPSIKSIKRYTTSVIPSGYRQIRVYGRMYSTWGLFHLMVKLFGEKKADEILRRLINEKTYVTGMPLVRIIAWLEKEGYVKRY